MNNEYLNRLKTYLASGGYLFEQFRQIPYGIQVYFSDGEKNMLLRIYENKKGKITLDVSPIKDEAVKNFVSAFNHEGGYPLASPPLIGSDEAGKGDYFGPLTVCALYADEKMYDALCACGVKDSKKLSDKKIDELKENIISICPNYSVIEIKNPVFNDNYQKIKNINIMLAKAHASAIKSVYEKTGCHDILTDKFASEYRLENELSSLKLNLVQKNRAEENTAVAAASILARYTYMARLKQMSEIYKIDFCAGAGENADACAQSFADKYGKERLNEVCKISYKNTEKIK